VYAFTHDLHGFLENIAWRFATFGEDTGPVELTVEGVELGELPKTPEK